ncbi:MAG: hypothetical protein AB7H80_13500 [Candidatus Kapaibacterium sp.]
MRYHLILLLILPILLLACGEEKEDATEKAPEMVIIEPPPLADTAYNPENEVVFEYTIWKEYAHLATQVPKEAADSVMRTATQSSPDPRLVRQRLKDGLARLNARQDTLARYTIEQKYGISQDSIQAIIVEVEAKLKSGEIER